MYQVTGLQRKLMVFCLVMSNPLVITRSVSVQPDFSWYAYVTGNVVPRGNQIVQQLPEKVNTITSLKAVLSTMESARICPGNPEEHFVDIVERKGGSVCGTSGQTVAYVDLGDVVIGENRYSKTVRRSDCELLCLKDSGNLLRCPNCRKYRSQLHVMRSRESRSSRSDKVKHDSHTNYRFLSSTEKDERLKSLQNAKITERKHNRRLSEKVDKLIDLEGISLEENDVADVTSIFSSVDKDVESTFKDSSLQRIFWDQQKHHLSMEKKSSMKWHPLLIRFALNLKYASSGAYHAIRQSGLIALPSERTLRDYTHWIKMKDGIQAEVIQHMKTVLHFNELEDHERHFALSIDEMKVRSGLVFRKDTGVITGFCNLGDVNNDFDKLSQSIPTDPVLAEHMLVFMVRSIFKPSFSFPVAMYPTANLTGERLYPVVWEVVEALELHGVCIMSLTSDGNSANRRFYRLCSLDKDTPQYKTENPYSRLNQHLYFICDPPHLLKTARNCFSNSHSHSRSRNLQRNGQDISWKHVEHLYMIETEKSGGLRLCPKLSRDHIWLTSFSRMRVYLAAQVMSETVASALQFVNEEQTRETRVFIRMIDKFFDVLNVKNPVEGQHKRKDNRVPFKSPKDERFKWLREDFLGYLEEWESEALSNKEASKKENRKRCISQQTLEGLRITVKSFIELGPKLLQLSGVRYLLSEVFSQDPLERYFSKQRHRGGSRENPTVDEFRTNTATLIHQQAIYRDLKTMNVEAISSNIDMGEVCQPLRKRSRKQ